MLNETVGIIIEDDTRVEQIVGVEDALQLLHHAIGFLAPLVFDKRRHIAARAMLGL